MWKLSIDMRKGDGTRAALLEHAGFEIQGIAAAHYAC
jgi:hypothetical protein